MQVLAVGIILDQLSTSTNVIDGCSANLSTGSSSVLLTKLRICPKKTGLFLTPIGIKEINHFLATILLNSQMSKKKKKKKNIYIYIYIYIGKVNYCNYCNSSNTSRRFDTINKFRKRVSMLLMIIVCSNSQSIPLYSLNLYYISKFQSL